MLNSCNVFYWFKTEFDSSFGQRAKKDILLDISGSPPFALGLLFKTWRNHAVPRCGDGSGHVLFCQFIHAVICSGAFIVILLSLGHTDYHCELLVPDSPWGFFLCNV